MDDQIALSRHNARASWMRTLALCAWNDLRSVAATLPDISYSFLRTPETGLVMLRGRVGSTGAPFNFGEATVTRCAVKLANGTEGHAYILGRNTIHATTAAICDALLQDSAVSDQVQTEVIEPLVELLNARRIADSQKAAATRVDFFTLVRGDV